MAKRRANPRIAVFGNINMDAVLEVPDFPRPGENRLGTSFAFLQGGKGANQARAAARLGGRVTLIGRVGADAFGDALRRDLANEGVNVRLVQRDQQRRTGMAFVMVSRGENRIVSVLGANLAVSPSLVRTSRSMVAGADLVLVQLGIPMTAVDVVIALGQKVHTPVLLDAGPIRGTLPRRWREVDILSPNESELQAFLGRRSGGNLGQQAKALLRRSHVRVLLIKLGSRGCLLALRSGEVVKIPPWRVKAIDPTGAGDAFCAGFAVAYGAGAELPAAARFACAAGALAATKLGAAPSLPTLNELRKRFPSAIPAVLT